MAGPMPAEVKLALITALSTALLNIGAATVLYMALGGFKYKLKVAYRYICTSQLFLAAGIGQYPVIAILDASDSAWSTFGLDNIPFVLSCLFGYVGLRMLAKLLDVKSRLLNPWMVLVAVAGLSVLALFIPTNHSDLSAGFTYEKVPFLLSLLESLGLYLVTALIYLVKKRAGTLYTMAFRWFFWGYAIYLVANILGLVLGWLLPAEPALSMLNLFFPVGAAVLLASAVSFNRIRFTEKRLAAAPKEGQPERAASSVDILITVAGLVSRPSDVDVIMDDVRIISAKLGDSKTLSPKEQAKLGQAYIRLETFLVNDEPVRKFNALDLRQMLDIRFRNVVNEPAFWKIIDTQPIRSPHG